MKVEFGKWTLYWNEDLGNGKPSRPIVRFDILQKWFLVDDATTLRDDLTRAIDKMEEILKEDPTDARWKRT